ncbi:hypothetical protein AZ78_1242 [Lysobacter capsici AZ78]|uniref:Uncharacterized protein n=1 Tax=Lysobacter capsici AZ78 TaxID=1444315 RepID=A0A120AFX2_9GAMM|nr:hypothetical protein AZ78_1242 [Lysobacter capsici AZ78]
MIRKGESLGFFSKKEERVKREQPSRSYRRNHAAVSPRFCRARR